MTPAMGRYRPILTAVLLGLVALVVGGRDLDRAPVYLYHDEAIYALNAHSILTTGRDLMGLRLPLFLHTFAWIPPIAIYARVLTYVFLPVTEFTTRFPGVVFFAIDVSLTYLVGRRLFKREALAILAGVFLMLTPAHLIHARLATDHICHMPFFIAFVWLIVDYIEAGGSCRSARRPPVSGWASTLQRRDDADAGLSRADRRLLFLVLNIRTLRPYVVAGAGMALAMLPFALWLLVHPETLTDQLRSYDVSSSGQAARAASAESLLGADRTARCVLQFSSIRRSCSSAATRACWIRHARSACSCCRLWCSCRPGVLHSHASRTHSGPVRAGGISRSADWRAHRREVKASRALVMAPLAALVCARGVEALMSARSLMWRAVAIVLLAALGLQFQRFMLITPDRTASDPVRRSRATATLRLPASWRARTRLVHRRST
jgi:hypothetical protein